MKELQRLTRPWSGVASIMAPSSVRNWWLVNHVGRLQRVLRLHTGAFLVSSSIRIRIRGTRTHILLRFRRLTLCLACPSPPSLSSAHDSNNGSHESKRRTPAITTRQTVLSPIHVSHSLARTTAHPFPRDTQELTPSMARPATYRHKDTRTTEVMYRPPSPPVYDPEPPTLRRVKPLPKRRRTSDPAPQDDARPPATPTTGPGDEQQQEHAEEQVPAAAAAAAPTQDPTLAARMALEAYYSPVLGGVHDLFKHTHHGAADGRGADSRTGTGAPISIDLSAALRGMLGYGTGAGGGDAQDGFGAGRGEEDDEDGGDGDYVDHLQQPGNTKKRKVPANMSGSAHGHDSGDGGSGAEDDAGDRGVATLRDREGDSAGGTGSAGGGTGGGGSMQLALGRAGIGAGLGKRGRLSRATLAGLQHKELLKSRKRLLSAVLGTLPQGDTLALDQALSANALFFRAQAAAAQLQAGTTGTDSRNAAPPPRVRLSRRRVPRLARALKAYKESHAQAESRDENAAPSDAARTDVPSGDFAFVFRCASEWWSRSCVDVLTGIISSSCTPKPGIGSLPRTRRLRFYTVGLKLSSRGRPRRRRRRRNKPQQP